VEFEVAGGVNLCGGEGWRDSLGHGTIVASAIVSQVPAVEIFAVKIFDHRLQAPASRLCEALVWCAAHNMDFINLSLGSHHGLTVPLPPGCIVVAPADPSVAAAGGITGQTDLAEPQPPATAAAGPFSAAGANLIPGQADLAAPQAPATAAARRFSAAGANLIPGQTDPSVPQSPAQAAAGPFSASSSDAITGQTNPAAALSPAEAAASGFFAAGAEAVAGQADLSAPPDTAAGCPFPAGATVIAVRADLFHRGPPKQIGSFLFQASPWPPPLPGRPAARGMSGVSFAVANVTAYLANQWRPRESMDPHRGAP
jgi:hypothetical protein